jgi:large subunit ribosomal protein L22
MAGPKTNEREGTRAVLRHYRMSATKARVVLDLIRGEDVATAREILASTNREAAQVIEKLLMSAIANAVNNDHQSADELYVASAYADEGATLKRFSPRARGRAGRIAKRSTHITIIVARMDDDRLEIVREQRSAQVAASRARRVAGSRRRADQQAGASRRQAAADARAEAEAAEAAAIESTESDEDVAVDEVTDEAVESTTPEVVDEAVADNEETPAAADEETEN